MFEMSKGCSRNEWIGNDETPFLDLKMAKVYVKKSCD